jgi:hypothetical protein
MGGGELFYMIIEYAIISSFATLLFRMLFSILPFRKTHIWAQIIFSTFLGLILWIILILLASYDVPDIKIKWADILCGGLILMCALWCNYWISNFSGGFRIQMLLILKNFSQPISIDEWMRQFGNLGMEAFLRDRMRSILIPWKIAVQEEGKIYLTHRWGVFFGRLFVLLDGIFINLRKSKE